MGSVGRQRALDLVIARHGQEIRDDVEATLPMFVRLVLRRIELSPGDSELIVDAIATDTDGSEARQAVASFALDELAERYPGLGLAW